MGHEESRKSLLNKISSVDDLSFSDVALELFQLQARYNQVYGDFLKLLHYKPQQVRYVQQIPFLPISVFKHRVVKTGTWQEEVIFQSSGDTKSRHFGRSLSYYHNHAIQIFEDHFGAMSQFEFFGLLPHYLEAGQSSLVSMVRAFMNRSGQEKEHFYLDDFAGLVQAINSGMKDRRPVLFGVSYALLDFANAHPASLPPGTMLFETGGMKGRKKEWQKHALQEYLRSQLKINALYSEYGMTELFSQAYASADAYFQLPKSMKILFKELNDPMAEVAPGKAGVAHIIDLANIDTCSFIATSDLGVNHRSSGIEILGRVQDSDLRGCQLLYL